MKKTNLHWKRHRREHGGKAHRKYAGKDHAFLYASFLHAGKARRKKHRKAARENIEERKKEDEISEIMPVSVEKMKSNPKFCLTRKM